MGTTKYLSPGALVNPFDGLTRSLENVARLDSEEKNKKADRAEAKRRFDTQQENTEAAALESSRRFGVQEGRLNAAATENNRRYNTEEKEKQRVIDVISSVTSNYGRKSAVDARIADSKQLSDMLKERSSKHQEIIARNTVLGLGIHDGNKLSSPLDYDGEEPTEIKSGDIPKDINFTQKMEELNKRGVFKGTDTYEKYISAVKASDAEIRNYVVDNLPLYQKAQESSVFKSLVAKGVDPVRASAIAKNVTLGIQNKSTLTKQAVEQQKTENARNVKVADTAFKVWKANGSRSGKSGNYSKGPKKGFQTEKEVALYIDSFTGKGESYSDLSDGQKEKLLNYWRSATDPAVGVDRNVAMKALGDFVEEAFFYGKNVKGNTKEFVEYARSIASLNSGQSTNTKDLIARFTPQYAAYSDPVELNNEVFKGGLRLLAPKNTQRLPNVYTPDLVDKDSDGPGKGVETVTVKGGVKSGVKGASNPRLPETPYYSPIDDYDIPGSPEVVAKRQELAKKYRVEPSFLAKTGAAVRAGAAIVGSAPGMVGTFGGSAVDIGNKWLTGNDSSYRDDWGRATSIMQLDESDRGTLAEKYLRNVTEPLSYLPPNMIPPALRGVHLPKRSLKLMLDKNKGRYATPLYDSVIPDAIPDKVPSVDVPTKSLASREVSRKANEVRKKFNVNKRLEDVKVQKSENAAMESWTKTKMELEASAASGNQIAKRALRMHELKKPSTSSSRRLDKEVETAFDERDYLDTYDANMGESGFVNTAKRQKATAATEKRKATVAARKKKNAEDAQDALYAAVAAEEAKKAAIKKAKETRARNKAKKMLKLKRSLDN